MAEVLIDKKGTTLILDCDCGLQHKITIDNDSDDSDLKISTKFKKTEKKEEIEEPVKKKDEKRKSIFGGR